MKFSMPRMLLLFVSLSAILLVPALHAQTSTSQLSGLVTDSSGAMLPHASVLIVNLDTGVSRSVQTDGQGQYSAPALQPGRYRITVEAKGFQTLVTDNVTLNVAQNASLGFQLKVGAENQIVTVDGSGQMINTTDASVSTVIDRKFVENIPLNGRSFQDLISMTPGVVTQSPQSQSSLAANGDFSVNGQRTESNYYTVDGVSGNINAGSGNGGSQPGMSGSIAASTALGTTQSLTSVDALQEFRVNSSTYSAEYGRMPGGQFSLVTRSGTNNFHGAAFDYLRNNFFDANDWFNDHYGDPQPALRQNDFGGTLGGPVRIPTLYNGKDRTFFFASYEGLRLDQPTAATIQYVPDLFMRQQAVPAIQPILNAYPLPNGIDYGTSANPSLAQFIEPYSLPSSINSTSIRADQVLPHLWLLFFRFSDTPSTTSSRVLSEDVSQAIGAQTYTLGLDGQLSNSITNQFRLGYSRANSSRVAILSNFGGAVPIDLTEAMGAVPSTNAWAIFEPTFSGIGTAALQAANSSDHGRQWNLTDTISVSMGHHQLKVGVDYLRVASPTAALSPLVESLYENAAAVLNNSATILVLEKTLASTPIFNETSAFVQDEWRVIPSLSLSYGLRWEVDPAPTGAGGKDAYTLLGNIANPTSLMLAPLGTPLWKTTWFNIAPRLGASWQLRNLPGRELVFRAGGGVFFDTDNEEAAKGFEGLGYFADTVLFSAPVPATAAELNFAPSTAPPYTSTAIYAFPSHLQLPYTLEWNTSLQQALGKNQTLTISYVGSNGRRLLDLQESSLTALNPNIGTVEYPATGITSNYQSLQIQFQRSITRGLQALASYTWSHSIDFGSNSAELPLQRGNSDFDVRNNFQGGISWDLPRARSREFVSDLINGWGLDARLNTRTAFPVTLGGNLTLDPATGSYYDGGLNLISGRPIYLYGSQYPGDKAINPVAFSIPPTGTAGNAPRNFVRGFGETQLNLAVRREFPIHNSIALQLRAEAFNILNHPNFGYVDPNYTDATFGQATMTLNQSLGTVASQYQQGGPRSMQFALKLLF